MDIRPRGWSSGGWGPPCRSMERRTILSISRAIAASDRSTIPGLRPAWRSTSRPRKPRGPSRAVLGPQRCAPPFLGVSFVGFGAPLSRLGFDAFAPRGSAADVSKVSKSWCGGRPSCPPVGAMAPRRGTVHAGSSRASATQWNGTSRRNGPCEPSAMDPSVGFCSSDAVTARPADLRTRKRHESGLRPNPVEHGRPDGGC
jgi:hypothetical protein